MTAVHATDEALRSVGFYPVVCSWCLSKGIRTVTGASEISCSSGICGACLEETLTSAPELVGLHSSPHPSLPHSVASQPGAELFNPQTCDHGDAPERDFRRAPPALVAGARLQPVRSPVRICPALRQGAGSRAPGGRLLDAAADSPEELRRRHLCALTELGVTRALALLVVGVSIALPLAALLFGWGS